MTNENNGDQGNEEDLDLESILSPEELAELQAGEIEKEEKLGISKDDWSGNRKNGNNKRKPIHPQPGLHSSMGHRSDLFPSTALPNLILGFLLEAADYKDARGNTWRNALLYPDWGKAVQGPQKHVRVKTEFFEYPISWIDEKVAYEAKQTQSDDGEVESVYQPRNIFQPRYFQTLPRGRRWTVWAKGGPLEELRTAESRFEVRKKYPRFRNRDDHNYRLIGDNPYCFTSSDLEVAMNPELKKHRDDLSNLSVEEKRKIVKSKRRDQSDTYTQWAHMPGYLQGSYLAYIAMLVQGGALEDPRGWNPFGTQFDPHGNDRFSMEMSQAVKIKIDIKGRPIPVSVGEGKTDMEVDDEGGGDPGSGEENVNLYINSPLKTARLEQLITTPEEAVEHYLTNGGYRHDFDPRPDKYRDLWGNYAPKRDLTKGIISDTERMSEVVFKVEEEKLDTGEKTKKKIGVIKESEGSTEDFKKPSIIKKAIKGISSLFRRRYEDEKSQTTLPVVVLGPSHSATDLFGELPAEEIVVIGKYIRHGKIRSRHERLYSVGEDRFSILEGDTGDWMGTAVPGMAKAILDDSSYYLPFLEFWTTFSTPGKGKNGIGEFMHHQVKKKNLEELGISAPSPVDFFEMCKNLTYFNFDPIECWYGYDYRENDDGTAVSIPRIPEALVETLAQKPSLRGTNLVGHDGDRVLDSFRTESWQTVSEFWGLTEEQWEEAVSAGEGSYLTMGWAFWNPFDDADSVATGFLAHLYKNQPILPIVERMDGKIKRLNRENVIHFRPEINKELEGVYTGPGSALLHYIEAWYELSDNRIWAHLYYLSELFSDLNNPGSMWGFSMGDAGKLDSEGFGTGYGTSKEQQERKERLYEIALNTKYWNSMKSIIRWMAVRTGSVSLMPKISDAGLEMNSSYVTLNEVKMKIAGYLEKFDLVPMIVRDYLWPHLKEQYPGIIKKNDEFPMPDFAGEEKVDWSFVRERLNFLAGNSHIPSADKAMAAADKGDNSLLETREQIGTQNGRWFVAMQTGNFQSEFSKMERRKVAGEV